MASLTARAFAGRPDLARLLDALSAAHAREEWARCMHPGDLVWALYSCPELDPGDRLTIWERADGTVAGFSLLDDGDLEVQTVTSDPGERTELLRAAVDDAVLRAEDGALHVEAGEDDEVWRRLLLDAGFERDDTRRTSRDEPYTGVTHLGQKLSPAKAPGQHAPDVVVRPVGEDEWPARIDLHRAVWEKSSLSLESYTRLRESPVYRPDLDLVAVAPDGTLLAYTIVWFDSGSGVGEFESVGTHPDHRRRGAAAAVMRAGLRRLAELGATRATVTSSADNPASLALYASVGFHPLHRTRFYRR